MRSRRHPPPVIELHIERVVLHDAALSRRDRDRLEESLVAELTETLGRRFTGTGSPAPRPARLDDRRLPDLAPLPSDDGPGTGRGLGRALGDDLGRLLANGPTEVLR